jgi:hypothetical protein
MFRSLYMTILRGLAISTLCSHQIGFRWCTFVVCLCSMRPYVITVGLYVSGAAVWVRPGHGIPWPGLTQVSRVKKRDISVAILQEFCRLCRIVKRRPLTSLPELTTGLRPWILLSVTYQSVSCSGLLRARNCPHRISCQFVRTGEGDHLLGVCHIGITLTGVLACSGAQNRLTGEGNVLRGTGSRGQRCHLNRFSSTPTFTKHLR